jgi:2-oxoglutarate ferredoxin oxidoreductase subunit alpha
MTPVILLTDGYISQGTNPWRIPELDTIPELEVNFATDKETYAPYKRDPKTLARMWAIPGTPGLEHRIGGLEKEDITGLVCNDPMNHEKMVLARQAKIDGIENDIPLAHVEGEQSGDLLIVGWGGTYGAIKESFEHLRAGGKKVSYMHLRHLNPLPKNVGEILGKFKRIVLPELNNGQLSKLFEMKFHRPILGIRKIQGIPLREHEVTDYVLELLKQEAK